MGKLTRAAAASCLLASFLLTGSVWAQVGEEGSAVQPDPMDLSVQEQRVGVGGLPQIGSIQPLRDRIDAAMDAGDCETALTLIPDYTGDANRLANIVRGGLEPFYSARYDDRDRIRVTDELIIAERMWNEMIRHRNEGWILEGDCLVAVGDTGAAAARYMHALDFISATSEAALWIQARRKLWDLVGAEVPAD